MTWKTDVIETVNTRNSRRHATSPNIQQVSTPPVNLVDPERSQNIGINYS